MKDFSEIKKEILYIESKFSVNSWKVNDIYIWPIIRIRLFFYFRNENFLDNKPVLGKLIKKENKNSSSSYSPFKRVSFFVKGKINVLRLIINYKLFLLFLPKRKYVFVAAEVHRVHYKNTSYNRFFDTLIEKYSLLSNSMYFEYGNEPIKKQYLKNNIYKFNKVLKTYLLLGKYLKKEEVKVSLNGYDKFLKYLSDNNMEGVSERYSKDKIENWAITRMHPKIIFFKKILKKINPQKIMILCYYSEEIMALTAAANQLGIQTIEMQHGPQTETHLAYGSWSVIPKKGYDMLPREYWCWDSFSASVLNNLNIANKLYSSKNIGNPWVDYWKNKKESYPYSGYILYAFQPIWSGTSIEDLLPENLIKFIKNESYKWFIRLHPRQMEQKEVIVSFLKKKGVFDKINIDDATNDPLPQLLANAKLHFTLNSGTTLEASFFNLKTVLIDELGKDYYADLIKKGEVYYLNPNDLNFIYKLKACVDEEKMHQNNTKVNSPLVNNLFD